MPRNVVGRRSTSSPFDRPRAGYPVVRMAGVAQTGDRRTYEEGGGFRLLVVAAEPIAGPQLREQIERRTEGRDAAVRVVSPALTDSRLKHAMGDVDEAIADAGQRLDESLEEVRGAGVDASGSVGDSDPLLAIEDALEQFRADEILILTHEEGHGRWLEDDIFDRARRKFAPPVTHVVVERDEAGGQHVADVESAPRGTEPPPDREVVGKSRNLPPYSLRDLAGIAVAAVGTTVLILLATGCGGQGHEGFDDAGCAARILIAGGALLINLAHVVGLVLFQSVRYRGPGERFFAHLSLWGTPVAVIVSLLVA